MYEARARAHTHTRTRRQLQNAPNSLARVKAVCKYEDNRKRWIWISVKHDLQWQYTRNNKSRDVVHATLYRVYISP